MKQLKKRNMQLLISVLLSYKSIQWFHPVGDWTGRTNWMFSCNSWWLFSGSSSFHCCLYFTMLFCYIWALWIFFSHVMFLQVVVGCYSGIIYFLDFSNGNICWTFQTRGEVQEFQCITMWPFLFYCIRDRFSWS